eukprot:CAMPEP_0198694108 /NCGR_PEP_ID=MMETSP1468-20131203/263276_1 /TAXON_ID=1461545 /ORGANISM="Mantoniella sp, Strain CCMP1436" /LENGTH=60 /DNA_ID=CAMNT_0044449111 /DNA_START=240 /DNA_END=419 /DNA_ORIENTATION=-
MNLGASDPTRFNTVGASAKKDGPGGAPDTLPAQMSPNQILPTLNASPTSPRGTPSNAHSA